MILEPEIKEGFITGFSMQLPKIDNTIRNTLSFKNLQLCAKTSEAGEIMLTVEGRDITKPISQVLGEIESASTIKIERIKTKVGVRNQKGGKVTITESDRGMLAKGKIYLELEGEPYIYYSKKPNIKVVEGDVEVRINNWVD